MIVKHQMINAKNIIDKTRIYLTYKLLQKWFCDAREEKEKWETSWSVCNEKTRTNLLVYW